MPVAYQRPVAQRVLSFGLVAALHVLVGALLMMQSGSVQRLRPVVLRAVPILPHVTPPPPPPALPDLHLATPDLAALPPPDVTPPLTPRPAAPRAVMRATAPPPTVSHFGPATEGLGLDVEAATSAGGGARGRGSLGDFQAAVKRAVLARKTQPRLAWDRRNTCVVNYTVTVAQDGSLAGLSIDPCAVPEINAAATAAIRSAAPFPAPPALGAAGTQVHGTLVFHP